MAETKKEVVDQAVIGKEMDEIQANQKMINDNAAVFKSDPSLFLYRLRLSNAQREVIFNKLMADSEKKA